MMAKKIYVTRTQADAARLMIKRAEASGKTASTAVKVIANARPVAAAR